MHQYHSEPIGWPSSIPGGTLIHLRQYYLGAYHVVLGPQEIDPSTGSRGPKRASITSNCRLVPRCAVSVLDIT
eukprot:1416183-Rhodomonas_salina.1